MSAIQRKILFLDQNKWIELAREKFVNLEKPETETVFGHLASRVQGGTLVISGAGALNSGSVRFGTGTSVAGTYMLDLSGATAPSGRRDRLALRRVRSHRYRFRQRSS